MKVKCAICAREIDEYDAHSLNIGRKMSYQCYDCYNNGRNQADHVFARWASYRKDRELKDR